MDYIVTFKVDKPNIYKYTKLRKLGTWSNYGEGKLSSFRTSYPI